MISRVGTAANKAPPTPLGGGEEIGPGLETDAESADDERLVPRHLREAHVLDRVAEGPVAEVVEEGRDQKQLGVRAVGGCCGTSPVRRAAWSPRTLSPRTTRCCARRTSSWS